MAKADFEPIPDLGLLLFQLGDLPTNPPVQLFQRSQLPVKLLSKHFLGIVKRSVSQPQLYNGDYRKQRIWHLVNELPLSSYCN